MVIPYDIEINHHIYKEGQNLKTSDLPAYARQALSPRVIAPSVEKFQELFYNLSQYYRDIIVLLTSANLTKAFENAQQARLVVQGRTRISVIDSQTTSVGLGLLVQHAAEHLASGYSATDIERSIRSLIPHIFMVLCTPGMSYLQYAGIVDEAQAFISEMLGLFPIFVLEDGRVSSVEKVRNSRGLIDFIQEFVLEFDNIQYIAYIQSTPGLTHEARLIRELTQNNFPHLPFSEHNINPVLATLIGPRSVGLVVVEKPKTNL